MQVHLRAEIIVTSLMEITDHITLKSIIDMGKVGSKIAHPLKNYNVEGRAHKIIAKEKPTPAPKYKSDELNVDNLIKEYPEIYEESLKKNENLDKHLRDVYVKSHDPDIKDNIEPNPDRPLPTCRSIVEEFEYGHKEPENVPFGKITLKNAMYFIGQHQMDPKKYNSVNIAEKYKLSEETVSNILKYFKVYEIYIPEGSRITAEFAGPAVKRRLVSRQTKELPPGFTDKK